MHISIDQNNANKMFFYFDLYDHENNAELILSNVVNFDLWIELQKFRR